MRRLRNMVIGAALVVGAIGVFAPAPAGACTGAACNAICDVANSKAGQKLFPNGCPLR
jgi:hypothetical protein